MAQDFIVSSKDTCIERQGGLSSKCKKNVTKKKLVEYTNSIIIQYSLDEDFVLVESKKYHSRSTKTQIHIGLEGDFVLVEFSLKVHKNTNPYRIGRCKSGRYRYGSQQWPIETKKKAFTFSCKDIG